MSLSVLTLVSAFCPGSSAKAARSTIASRTHASFACDTVTRMRRLAVWLATSFGAGYFPVAPGTAAPRSASHSTC